MTGYDAVLAGIDGALADLDLPDAMRWSPAPGSVTDASDLPYDGAIVPQPPQRYEEAGDPAPGFQGGNIPPSAGPWSQVAGSDPLGDVRRAAAALRVDRGWSRPPLSNHALGTAVDLNATPLRVHARREGAEVLMVLASSAEEAARLFAAYRDAARRFCEGTARAIEALTPAFAAAGQAIESLSAMLRGHGLVEDEGPDRVEQPFERAMWVKAQQGTGPDRQVQRRPRPRRHLL